MQFVTSNSELKKIDKNKKRGKTIIAGDIVSCALVNKTDKSIDNVKTDYYVQPDLYVNSFIPKLPFSEKKLVTGIEAEASSYIEGNKKVYMSQLCIIDWYKSKLKNNATVFGLYIGNDNQVYVQIFRFRKNKKRMSSGINSAVELVLYHEKVLSLYKVSADISNWLISQYSQTDDELHICGETIAIPNLDSIDKAIIDGEKPFSKASYVSLSLHDESKRKHFVIPVIGSVAALVAFAVVQQGMIAKLDSEKDNYRELVSMNSNIYDSDSVSIQLLQDRQYYLETYQLSKYSDVESISNILKSVNALKGDYNEVFPTILSLDYFKDKKSSKVSGVYNFQLALSFSINDDVDKNSLSEQVVESLSDSLGIPIRTVGQTALGRSNGKSKELIIKTVGYLENQNG